MNTAVTSVDRVHAGIDIRVVLALHALGVRAFGDGRTAAVPQPATGFSFESLRFAPGGDGRAETFARLLNSRVDPPVGTPRPRMLWDVYAEVLDPARTQVADREPTPAEKARYQAARGLLTPEVLATYFACRQALGHARLERDRAGGSQAEVDEARARLRTTGRASEVEAALAVVEGWSDASATVSWQDHRSAFASARISSPDGVSSYYPTYFVPTDVLDGRGWTRITLPGPRIAELIGHLPAPVAALAGEVGPDGDSGLSVELTAVEILRPWFDPGVLRSPAWRFREAGTPAVSDGTAGDFPYLTTGLVLARNLSRNPAEPPGIVPFHPLPPPTTDARPPLPKTLVDHREARSIAVADTGPARIRASDDWLSRIDFASPSGSPESPPEPGAEMLIGADEVVAVAYLLEPVGAAPHPDPALNWR